MATDLGELCRSRLSAMCIVIVCCLIAIPSFAKRKDDVIVMTNGDTFTGEIKQLTHGELVFNSAYMKDSVHLDWAKVDSMQSKDAYIVSLSNGQRVTGLICKVARRVNKGEQFEISEAGSILRVPAKDVISIKQKEQALWNQLTGSVNYGFGFASGASSTNSSLSADVLFNGAKNSARASAGSQFDSQANAKNANRFTFDSEYGRTLSRNWTALALFSLLKSNQQDLDLRSTYGGALSRKLIQTDRTTLAAIGGMTFSHEHYAPQPGTKPVLNNAEAVLGLTLLTFRFKTFSLDSQTLLFPSVGELGRVRASSQSELRIELIRNLVWNFQLYENYDTRPPVKAPKNDLGITTSVGWTF